MSEITDVKLLELMASKICHDLISPIGAVSNGVEFLEEMGADAGEEVTSLIGFSATQANAKLRTLRMAYGLGGADDSIKAEDVHKTFGDFIGGEERIKQDWDAYADLGIENCKGRAKIMLNAMLLISEALPKGGIVKVKGDGDSLLITAEGENAHFRDGYVHALEHRISVDDLDPKLVHAYVTGLLSKHYGFSIDVDETQNDFICLRLRRSVVS